MRVQDDLRGRWDRVGQSYTGWWDEALGVGSMEELKKSERPRCGWDYWRWDAGPASCTT